MLVVLIAFLLGSFAANNTDIWQYLATGRLLSEGKYTLGEDPFAAGVPADGPRAWVNQSWLFRGFPTCFIVTAARCWWLSRPCLPAALAGILLLIRPRNRHGWAGTLCVLLGILAASLTGFQAAADVDLVALPGSDAVNSAAGGGYFPGGGINAAESVVGFARAVRPVGQFG